MAIPKNKLNGEKDGAVIEVINVKIPQEEGEKLCGTEGIYPAWHMNKKELGESDSGRYTAGRADFGISG